MNITFICSSLEPGSDGVGDYTRRLAGELIRSGHRASIIAFNDKFKSEETIQYENGSQIPVLRIYSTTGERDKIKRAKGFIESNKPDLLSLQFVPYGFQRKGFPYQLGRQLKAINSTRDWHIMFHELWLGLSTDASLWHRAMGGAQRMIIKKLLNTLKPKWIHTSIPSYLEFLKEFELKNLSMLPLFSNINFTTNYHEENPLPNEYHFSNNQTRSRADCIIAGVFGKVHPEWDLIENIDGLLPLGRRMDKHLVVCFFGLNRIKSEQILRWNEVIPADCTIVQLGSQPPEAISEILKTIDIGLATSPWNLIGKSGSAIAMLDHGLPVVVSRDDWKLRASTDFEPDQFPGLIKLDSIRSLPPEKVFERRAPSSSLIKITEAFIKSIQ